MQRRLSRAIPFPQTFKTRIYEKNERYKGSNINTNNLHRKAKIKARLEDLSLSQPDLENTFPGLSQLPTAIRNQSFSLSGEDIRSRGKALGVPIGEQF